ncbi:toll-like receptor 4 [Physella acuta]|uniref:toll-like receptor 4 n=1 Tax=Physella acuta TaxID=109671 RepID=UPI0027DEA815|nr:toll-like receptor 4 [Physella acuta]
MKSGFFQAVALVVLCCQCQFCVECHKFTDQKLTVVSEKVGQNNLTSGGNDVELDLDDTAWAGEVNKMDGHRYDSGIDTRDYMSTDYQVEESMAESDDYTRVEKTSSDHVTMLPPRDTFLCPPCVCLKQVLTFANCTSTRLKTIPQGLPQNITTLDMSLNNMAVFNVTNIQRYRFLSRLVINHNRKLTRIAYVTRAKSVSLAELDLQTNHITAVEDNSLALMTRLRSLNLRGNMLSNITNFTFAGLVNLNVLIVSANQIQFIEPGAFEQLKNLQILDISCNVNLGYKRMFPWVFAPLQGLRQLFIHGSSRSEEVDYPNKMLGELKNLEMLSADGLPRQAIFGPEVKTLTNLTELKLGLSSRCAIKSLTKSFFTNLPFLKSLEMYHCDLARVEEDAYELVNLTRLSLTYMANYDLVTALDDLKYLHNSSLRSLSFIHLYHSSYPCRFLNGSQAVYLRNFPLEELDLTDNRLALLTGDFTNSLPVTIRKLVLANNRFTFRQLSFVFVNLKHLHELDVSQQNYFKDFAPRWGKQHCKVSSESQSTKRLAACSRMRDIQPTISVNISGANQRSCNQFTEADGETTTNGPIFPKSLKIIKATHFNSFGMLILDKEKPGPEDIDVSNSFLSLWGSGVLPSGIRRARLYNNYCTKIKVNFFQKNNSLSYLDIHDNFLGPGFAEDVTGSIFEHTRHVRHLDMRRNLIYALPKMFFKGLTNIEVLILSDNKIQVLNCSFSTMKKLTYVDLSRNSISWISEEVRNEFDELSQNRAFFIDLSHNPLPCTCSGIDFLHWMSNTKAVFLNTRNLFCHRDSGEMVSIGDVSLRLKALQHQCAPKTLAIVVSVVFTSTSVTFLLLALAYRFRWRLRYLWAITLVKLIGFEPSKTADLDYKFDAYLIYSDETREFVMHECTRELEEKRGHKICFEERNFMPGSLVVSDIVSAVQHSFKTVPVISPEFFAETYTEYALNMASEKEAHSRRRVLHLCVYRPLNDDAIPLPLLAVMKRNDITEFPPEEFANVETIQVFWDQLSRAIGHGGNAEDVNEQIG